MRRNPLLHELKMQKKKIMRKSGPRDVSMEPGSVGLSWLRLNRKTGLPHEMTREKARRVAQTKGS